jgi:hypothetical protein
MLFHKSYISFEAILACIISEHKIIAIIEPKCSFPYAQTPTVRPLSWAATGQGGGRRRDKPAIWAPPSSFCEIKIFKRKRPNIDTNNYNYLKELFLYLAYSRPISKIFLISLNGSL